MLKICIDPGHGGTDRANRGPTGYVEADGVLDIAKRLRILLQPYFKVIMTREKDETVSLQHRSQIANEEKVDALISIHTNAGPLEARGIESFYSFNGQWGSRYFEKAQELAGSIQKKLIEHTGLKNRGTKTRIIDNMNSPNWRKDYYSIIRESRCPVVLIEAGFHSNPQEESLLKTEEFRQKIALAIAEGVKEVFGIMDKNQRYPDVAPDRWSYNDIDRMARYGLMEGFPDGTFQPTQPITREQMASLMARLTFRLALFTKCDIENRINPAVATVFTNAGLGTGFWVSRERVVTNRHVVGNDKSVTLIMDGQPNRTATVVAISSSHDLALLQPSLPNDAFLKVSERELYQGKHVAVIGSPRGLSYSLTQGVISHPRRSVGLDGPNDCFQTDAAINPGNSGGPVIDGYGEVVGVAVAKHVGENIDNIGLAIRNDVLREFLKENKVI